MVLPEPLSPTMPRFSPSCRSIVTWSTAIWSPKDLRQVPRDEDRLADRAQVAGLETAARRAVEPVDRGRESASIRVAGALEDRLDVALLDQLAIAHHRDRVGDLGHHAHVVGDEHHRHAALVLQLADQLEDLGLDRHVQRGRRLVGDQHRRVAGERHGDHGPLPHAAGILERVAVDGAVGVADLDLRSSSIDALPGLAPRHLLVQRRTSPIWSPMRCTGDSELIGSWKIMAMSRPRIARMAEEVGASGARSTTRSAPATLWW